MRSLYYTMDHPFISDNSINVDKRLFPEHKPISLRKHKY